MSGGDERGEPVTSYDQLAECFVLNDKSHWAIKEHGGNTELLT